MYGPPTSSSDLKIKGETIYLKYEEKKL